jgi:hypothetical protein
MKSPSPNKLMSLPANPSGWMGRIFGKLMESTNVDAYQKTLRALNPIDIFNSHSQVSEDRSPTSRRSWRSSSNGNLIKFQFHGST